MSDPQSDRERQRHEVEAENERRSEALLDQILREAEAFGAGSVEEMLDAHRGAPAASKAAIEELGEMEITAKQTGAHEECAICRCSFKLGETCFKMLCKHYFHDQCLLFWLKDHNSCPMCRFELPSTSYLYDMLKLSERSVPAPGLARPEAAPLPCTKPPRELSLMFS